MHTILVVLLCILTIVSILSFYGLYRNKKVCKYRHNLLDRIFNSQNCHQLLIYYHNISYEEMLYSFKPLKDKYWFNEEFINNINKK